MIIMKKVVILVLCLVMVLLVSCKQPTNSDASSQVESSKPTYDEFMADSDRSGISNAYSLTQAQEAVQKYRNLRAAYVGGPVEFIVALGFDRDRIETGKKQVGSDVNVYHVTDIYYFEFAMKVAEIMSGSWFEKEQTWLGSVTLNKNEGCFKYDEDMNLLVLDATNPERVSYTVNSIRKGEDNTYITNETVMLDSGETKEITARVGLTEYDGNIVLAFWEEITATESDEILPAPLS
jgi:hypothetical protein